MDKPVFGEYSRYYDLLYSDKNYDEECDFLESAFGKYSAHPVRSILDLGCGSGNHALRMAARKYAVTGLDLSEGMLGLAGEKAAKAGLNIPFHQCDMRDLNLEAKFDAVVCMFAALNYMTENGDIKRVLSNVRGHLKPGGLFVFDSWNGLAVMRTLPEGRCKVIERDGLKIIRAVTPELDAAAQTCRNHYRMYVLEDGRLVREIVETHAMRFLFPREISYYLTELGYKVERICVFPYLDRDIDGSSWNMAIVAKAGN
jgi:SAM-dependent methyltransferase